MPRGTTTIASPPTASLPGATQHTRGVGALPSLGQAAMSLAIYCPNSAVLSSGSVATTALAVTLSRISSFLLSAL